MPPHLLLAEPLKGAAIQNDEVSWTGGPDDVQASKGLKLPHHDLSHRSQFLGKFLLSHTERQRSPLDGGASLKNVSSQTPADAQERPLIEPPNQAPDPLGKTLEKVQRDGRIAGDGRQDAFSGE